jgi:arylsulfatase A-like enzyme
VLYDDISWGVVLLSLGVCAPYFLLMAALSGVAARAWMRIPAVQRFREAPDGTVSRWLWDGPAGDRIAGAALALTVLSGSAACLAAIFVVSLRVVLAVRTPSFAVGLSILLALSLAMFFAALLPLIHVVGSWLLRALATGRWVGSVVRPITIIGGFACALVGTAVVVLWTHHDVVAVLPYNLVVLPLLAGSSALLAIPRLARAPRRLRFVAVALSGVLVVAALLAMTLPGQSWRGPLVRHASIARACLRLTTLLVDFDGDGAIGAYGGRDCSPFDGAIGPHATEVPANGVDEDCSGYDAKLSESQLVSGAARSGRPAGIARSPHIILLTTDGLSYRHTGLGGYARPVTPELDGWSERSTVFESAFTTGPATALAFPALFTGISASSVSMRPARNGAPPAIAPGVSTLAALLRAHGYATVAVVGGRYFFPDSWIGLTAGFDVVDTDAVREAEHRTRSGKVHTSPEVTAHALEHMKLAAERPLFLWVHYFDHHPRFAVPAGERPFGEASTAVDRYDSELAFSDRHWGRLLAAVEAAWSPSEYLMIFTADHGEAFDANHPDIGHDHCLRTEEVQVPLLIQAPLGRGRRVRGLASHLDVVPTVLDVVGASSPYELEGETLVPVVFGDAQPQKHVVFTMYHSLDERAAGRDPFVQFAVRTDEMHYFEDRQADVRSLVRWRLDPLEREDLTATNPAEAESLRTLGHLKIEQLRRVSPAGRSPR